MAGKQSSEVKRRTASTRKTTTTRKIIRRKEAEHIQEICQYKGIAHASQ